MMNINNNWGGRLEDISKQSSLLVHDMVQKEAKNKRESERVKKEETSLNFNFCCLTSCRCYEAHWYVPYFSDHCTLHTIVPSCNLYTVHLIIKLDRAVICVLKNKIQNDCKKTILAI